MHGIVIAGTHSGCGKTTITLGILAALKKKGIQAQAFKAGPDFIDSGLHRLITGRPSRNLDVWMCGEEQVVKCFETYSSGAEISVIEGVMGLYDGNSSTARLANLLNLPVVLVVDAYGMAESAGAVAQGFVEYNKKSLVTSNKFKDNKNSENSSLVTRHSSLNFAGVIFNRTASERHYKRLKESVENIPVLGHLPRDLNFEIPHRHLGLTAAEESPISSENIDRLAEAVLEYINVEAILGLSPNRLLKNFSPAKSRHSREGGNPVFSKVLDSPVKPALEGCNRGPENDKIRLFQQPSKITVPSSPPLEGEDPLYPSPLRGEGKGGGVKIAVAYDKAFCFYYEDNLDYLRNAGAEIIKFSPVSGSKIPDPADAVYIGGGYPELYCKELAKNSSMLRSINEWADSGRPLYAECGGLMYLSEGIYDFDGNFFNMAGIFSFETQISPCPPLLKGGMGGLRPRLGYREVLIKENCIMGKKGSLCRGHEFHYSEILGTVPDLRTQPPVSPFVKGKLKGVVESGPSPWIADTVYSVQDSSDKHIQDEGYKFKNTLASYIHIHFGSNSQIAGNFVRFIKKNTV